MRKRAMGIVEDGCSSRGDSQWKWAGVEGAEFGLRRMSQGQ